MNAKTIGTALFEGTIEGLVIKAFDLFKEPLQKSGEDFLKAHTGGRGVHDETLFQSACAHAVIEFGVTADEIMKIMTVINSLVPSERRRVVEIIGQSEEAAKIKMPVMEGGVPVHDKKGNVVNKEISTSANIRGAQIIFLLSKMTPDQIKEFFEASNAMDTGSKRREETIKNIVENPAVKKIIGILEEGRTSLKGDLEKRMTGDNCFSRYADKLRQERLDRAARKANR